ncbi:MAG TPA: hypothetical protein VF719_11650 [Abditibacteriaceae bacterium]
MKRLLIVASCLCLSATAYACINDRDSDTLEREGKGLPPVLQIVTGRFERNPPQYFEMRLARVTKELAANPNQLSLYDDAAVASDRLGRSAEAITWIEKKRTVLQKMAPSPETKDKALREAWYRYYANGGTFIAHRWIHDGADRTKIAEMKTARAMIAKAIHIKPDAHFGREKYQLMAMDWIIKAPVDANHSLTNSINLYADESKGMMAEEKQHFLKQHGLTDAVEGLTGLVALGAAWESVDVFYSLQGALNYAGKGNTEEMVRLRTIELIDRGRTSLHPDAPLASQLKFAIASPFVPPAGQYTHSQRTEIFQRLRDEADDYHARRTAYTTERMNKGLHPDTHPDFWKEWHDAGPPPARPFTFWEKRGSSILLIGLTLVASLVGLKVKTRRRKAALVK